jgi:hypothetical protein
VASLLAKPVISLTAFADHRASYADDIGITCMACFPRIEHGKRMGSMPKTARRIRVRGETGASARIFPGDCKQRVGNVVAGGWQTQSSLVKQSSPIDPAARAVRQSADKRDGVSARRKRTLYPLVTNGALSSATGVRRFWVLLDCATVFTRLAWPQKAIFWRPKTIAGRTNLVKLKCNKSAAFQAALS